MHRRCPEDRNEAFNRHMARLRAPRRVPEQRDALRRAILDLAEEASVSPPPPLPTPHTRALDAGLTPAQREKNRILCDAWDELDPVQRAALRIAESMMRQSAGSPDDALRGCLMFGVCGLPAAWMLLNRTGGLWGVAAAAGALVGFCWMSVDARRTARRQQERLEAADLQVALAMDHAGRYLDALAKLEAAELAGWELLRGEVRMERPFTRRRERLCARLGFSRSSNASGEY